MPGVKQENLIAKRIGLCLLAVLLSGSSRLSLAQRGAEIDALPDGAVLTDGSSQLEVRILEDRLASVHVLLDGKQSPRTPVLAPHPSLRPPAALSRREDRDFYRLSTPGLTVRIEKSSPHRIVFLNAAGKQLLQSDDPFGEAREGGVNMQHADGETLYGVHGIGLKETDGKITRNEGGKVAAGTQGDSGAPWVFTNSYGLLVDSDGGEFSTSPGRIRFSHDSRGDIEYFVFAGLPLQTIASLSRLVGTPELPPKWTLGFINSQWGITEAEAQKIVATYREKQLPIDGLIFDFDWKAWGEDDYGEWRWNSTSGAGNVAPDKFPDGASGEFARWMSARGVKLGGILKPRILTTAAGTTVASTTATIASDRNTPTVAAAYATEHDFWYPGEKIIPDYFSHRMARDIDFNNPQVRSWYWQHLLPAFQTGMWAWWNDEADEAGGVPFNNFQFLNMGRALYEGQRASSNLRVWSINRNFYLGASRYGYAGWSGDIDTGFSSMAFQRRRMLAALDTGEFHWGMDTGGFNGHPTPENYARWMELAAFVPIMRVHGQLDEKRQPWVYGLGAEEAARRALDLRYSLLPYIYSYERLNTEGEVGLVRPLFWEFPSDPHASKLDSEWMFGDSMLVAPVVAEGARTENVYLPAGEWYEYTSGRRYVGAKTVALTVDAKSWKDIPVFVRAGSIVATQPVEQYVGQVPLTEMTLDIFPSRSAAVFTAYDDDGTTYDYEKGFYLRQRITAQSTGTKVSVTVEGATGSYSGPLRSYLLRIHASAHEVVLNGERLSLASASGFQASGIGWIQDKDRFGPVVLVRIAAGGAKPAALLLH
jgi:alpha-glucosidase